MRTTITTTALLAALAMTPFLAGSVTAASAYKAPDTSPPAATTTTTSPAATPAAGSTSAPADTSTAAPPAGSTTAPASDGSTTAPAANAGQATTQPAADTEVAPAGGYQPPSVESTPGGVTIYRGSGTN